MANDGQYFEPGSILVIFRAATATATSNGTLYNKVLFALEKFFALIKSSKKSLIAVKKSSSAAKRVQLRMQNV